MKQYVICKDEAERDQLLRDIETIGINGNYDFLRNSYEAKREGSIGYDSESNFISWGWGPADGKQTTIPRFLIGLKIEKLKQERRALPKLGEE